MSLLVKLLITTYVCFGISLAAKLPHYLQPCHKSDKDINACGLEKATTALKEILKGDKNFRLPALSPLKLPEVTISPSNSLTMKFMNLVITGLESAKVKDIKMELDKNRWVFVVDTKYLNMKSDYEMNGRILVLPVTGKGPAEISFDNATFSYTMNYKFNEKNGKRYAKIENPTLTYTTDRTHYDFQNLFNGDPRLGPELNNFLNENWQEVAKDIGPAFSETVNSIITSIASTYLDAIPYDVLLPD